MKTVERNRYDGKRIFETRTLTFEPYPYDEIEFVIKKIQDNLTPDLLKGRKSLMYPSDVLTNKYYGHCYHSSQALYYLIDTDKLVSMSGEDYRGEKHWWLQDGERIYDCTANQYLDKGKNPPYNIGKKTNWYGWKHRPQQVSLNLMKRILGNRLESDHIC
tara:strand:- start:8469 stop:8948 length:480 start_codon:yes stop_codon:yes gene_type:complete